MHRARGFVAIAMTVVLSLLLSILHLSFRSAVLVQQGVALHRRVMASLRR